MNQLPDDIFQIFLKYNHQEEIYNLLSIVREDDDYRLKKYIYFISNEIKAREMDKVLKIREKQKKQINDWCNNGINDGLINYENILDFNNTLLNLAPVNQQVTLDDFFNIDLKN